MKEIKPKILVVEDDPEMLRLLGEVLTRFGVEPRCLTSSQQAAQLINREKFDAVILDWLMPGLNGLELAERIRWSRSNSRCPIVMITGIGKPQALKESFRAGINYFLQKPVTVREIERLLNAMRGALLQERRRYQRAAVETPVRCEWEIQSFRQKAQGVSVNLSASGILVRLDVVPPPQVQVSLKFTLPGDPQPYALTASVVRIAPDQQVGLRFDLPSGNQRARLIESVDRALREGPEG